MNLLSAFELKKSFEEGVSVLRGIQIAVKPGSITAIIGPSGAGKTTLLRALSLVDPPDSGQLQICGRSYSYPRDSEQIVSPWPEVTVVFQQLFLWPHLSLRENILLPVRHAASSEGGADRAEELVDFFNLRDALGRRPNEASVGQRQRAAIVRALALGPKLLLLDEVTSALDVEHVQRLGEALRLFVLGGGAIVLVTHLMGFARQFSDSFLFLEDGLVIDSGEIAGLRDASSTRVKRFVELA